MVPFAALTVTGVLGRMYQGPAGTGWRPTLVRTVGQLLVISAVAGSATMVGPVWSQGARRVMTQDDSQPSRQALAYAVAHIPRGSILLVDDNLWTDLVRQGFNPNPIWFYKLDLDPTVQARLKNGWRDIDYVILGRLPPSMLRDLPLVAAATRHSTVEADFGYGEITIRRVVPTPPETSPRANEPAAAQDRP
jgi:hypothetical protein